MKAAGEWNDALISYRQAAEYYQNAAEKTGVGVPKDIGYSLVRLTRKLGFTDEFERFRQQYGEPLPRPENTGELILFYESGYVPPKSEESLMFPILKTDDVDDDKFVPTLMRRQGMTYKDIELEYLLRIAMPTIDSRRPHFTGVEVEVGQDQERGVLVEGRRKHRNRNLQRTTSYHSFANLTPCCREILNLPRGEQAT